MTADARTDRRRAGTAARYPIAPRLRRALVTVHIVVAVGLLGDSAGFLAVAIRAAGTEDPQLAAESYRTLEMFAAVFGIPLSFATLLTGIALGLTSRWGVLRYPWVIGKLLLIVSVILAGALVIDGALERGPGAGDAGLIAAASWDVAALTLATALAVHRPGRRLGSKRAAAAAGPPEREKSAASR